MITKVITLNKFMLLDSYKRTMQAQSDGFL